MILFQVTAWPGSRDRNKYAQTVSPPFCSFNAVITKNGAEQLTPAAMKWDHCRVTDTQWHIIPEAMADEVNLQGSEFEFLTELEAVLAHYFCANFMEAMSMLEGKLSDGKWEVPIPMECSQGLRGASSWKRPDI